MTAASADLRSLAIRMSSAGGDINIIASNLIKDTAKEIQSVAQSLSPVKSGALRRSITINYETATRAVIGPHVIYGPFQEFGTGSRGEFPTGPYTIKPKNGKVLAFKVAGGKTVFTREVKHPGIKAQTYTRPAIKRVIDTIAPELSKQGALKIVGN